MARQDHVLVGAALLELVGTGAHKGGEGGGNAFLGHDDSHARGQGQLGQQRSTRYLEFPFNGEAAFGIQADGVLADRLAARCHVHPTLERGHHVLCVEVAAAVQLDAFADVDAVGQAIGRHSGHAVGQHGDCIPLAVKGVERLIDVLHDGADQVGRGGHRVQALRLADHGQIGCATLGWCGHGGQRQGC